MRSFKSLVYPYIVWISIFIVIPMFLILLYAFTSPGNVVTTINFTFDNFYKFFNPDFIRVLGRSFVLAVTTTFFCVLIGYPVAYSISKLKPRWQGLFIILVTAPQWINMLIRTYAWIGILNDNGLLNQFLGFFKIGPIYIMNTNVAVLIGMVYNFLPFMILPIHTILSKMDTSLIEASYDLGADRFQTFKEVVMPLSIPGVLAGITMVFLPSVSTFFIPKLLGGGKSLLIGNLIEEKFITSGDWNFGSAISLILAVLVLISIYLTRKIDKDKDGNRLGGMM
ncbi:MAG: ABC transporter permease [Erysipelothrix sp.]|nr:ABC transporter permease [Erysipelothrix sp.]